MKALDIFAYNVEFFIKGETWNKIHAMQPILFIVLRKYNGKFLNTC